VATFIGQHCLSIGDGSGKASEQDLVEWSIHLLFKTLKKLTEDLELQPVSLISVLVLSSHPLQIPTIARPHATIEGLLCMKAEPVKYPELKVGGE